MYQSHAMKLYYGSSGEFAIRLNGDLEVQAQGNDFFSSLAHCKCLYSQQPNCKFG